MLKREFSRYFVSCNQPLAVEAALDQFAQLVLGVGVGGGIIKIDGPIDRYFHPQKEPQFICNARHMLVMGIVRGTQKIAAQIARVGQTAADVSLGRNLGEGGVVLVHADDFELDRRAIQHAVSMKSVGNNGAADRSASCGIE
jgi:hypothetical protein